MRPVKVGVIGCGNISAAYLKAARSFPGLDIVALCDQNPSAAKARGAEFDIAARTVAETLADEEIEIILNLTVPKAHVEVGLAALDAGKHVYCEKPIGVNVAEARRLIDAAKAKGLRLGSAPDTFLGGAQQRARQCLDDGQIGTPVGGTAFFMCPGHERWHPSPAFYYLAGGGPMLDMGPYYVTALVNLLGPVAEVVGVATRSRAQRLITSEPLKGSAIPVEVATHVTGVMRFVNGAAVSITMSFDVLTHKHAPLEIYGEAGSLIVPDPNHFDGEVQLSTVKNEWVGVPTERPYADANYRILGLADMAQALRTGRPHRASGDLAFHALEVMEAFQRSSDTGRAVSIESRPARPAAMPATLKTGELD